MSRRFAGPARGRRRGRGDGLGRTLVAGAAWWRSPAGSSAPRSSAPVLSPRSSARPCRTRALALVRRAPGAAGRRAPLARTIATPRRTRGRGGSRRRRASPRLAERIHDGAVAVNTYRVAGERRARGDLRSTCSPSRCSSCSPRRPARLRTAPRALGRPAGDRHAHRSDQRPRGGPVLAGVRDHRDAVHDAAGDRGDRARARPGAGPSPAAASAIDSLDQVVDGATARGAAFRIGLLTAAGRAGRSRCSSR